MVCSWQVPDGGGSDCGGQLHMVRRWEVSNWIRSISSRSETLEFDLEREGGREGGR